LIICEPEPNQSDNRCARTQSKSLTLAPWDPNLLELEDVAAWSKTPQYQFLGQPNGLLCLPAKPKRLDQSPVAVPTLDKTLGR
jgi:hypothetical protein